MVSSGGGEGRPFAREDFRPSGLGGLFRRRAPQSLLMREAAARQHLAAMNAQGAGDVTSVGPTAGIDSLTSLMSRTAFVVVLDDVIAGLGSSDIAGVAFFDIDDFKLINDAFGHALGDRVLIEVGSRLDRWATDYNAAAARFGGDEFVLLAPRAYAADEIEAAFRDAKARIERPLVVDGFSFDISAGLGIALSGADPISAEELLRRSDVAMYRAKSGRKGGVVVYDEFDDRESIAFRTIATDLRTALADGSITAFFQPELDLRTGEVVAVEALARWVHPERGMIPPHLFVPIAERSGRIHELTALVAEEGLETLRDLSSDKPDMRLTINLSSVSLGDTRLVGRVELAASQLNVDPGLVVFEVSEASVLAAPQQFVDAVELFADHGFALGIDSVGANHLSLSQFGDLSLSHLKCDRSIVGDATGSPEHRALVNSIATLGHTFGWRVVAHGVEDDLTSELVRSGGYDSGLGFYYSRPVAADQIGPTLRRLDRLMATDPTYTLPT